MELILRPGHKGDVTACASILYSAFKRVADQHNFLPDFPSKEVATEFLASLFSHSGFYSVVVEKNGKVIGSNFIDERSAVAGLGPLTVDPEFQNEGIGFRLMEHVIERTDKMKFSGVRLLQDAFHPRSFALYSKLGFRIEKALSVLQGPVIQEKIPGIDVRLATRNDFDACNRLCQITHGYQRGAELIDALNQGAAYVSERNGHITGYTTGVAFFGHTVAQTFDDMKALIGGVPAYGGPGFLLPACHYDVLNWALDHGLKVVKMMTFMSRGLYHVPTTPYMPSVLS